jgi:uncharacterized membrane protein YoaK (UPF0700 family)
VAVGLSAVAGFVDAAGFVALFGLFTAHVTGELVAAGAFVAEGPTWSMLVRLAMIPLFMIAVGAAVLLARWQKRRKAAPVVSLLALMTAALAIFCVTGIALHPLSRAPDNWAVGIVGGMGVVAMGFQNALMKDVLKSSCPTTFMTGNLTQVTIDLVELFFESADLDAATRATARAAARARLFKFGLPLAGFVVGAGAGAYLTRAIGLASVAVPTLVAGAMTLIASRVAPRAIEPAKVEVLRALPTLAEPSSSRRHPPRSGRRLVAARVVAEDAPRRRAK